MRLLIEITGPIASGKTLILNGLMEKLKELLPLGTEVKIFKKRTNKPIPLEGRMIEWDNP